MDLQAALQAFLRQVAADGRSPHTIGQYRRHGTALATWLSNTGASADVADLSPDVLARFFGSDATKTSCRGGPKKATSANAMRTSIRCFAAHLHQSGLVATNPARMLRRARCAPPPPRALHADEEQRLRDALTAATGAEAARDRMLVELLLGTGIRIGSALALDVGDIDLGHGEMALRRTKNDRPTTAILPARVAERLQAFLGDRTIGPVFMANDHRVSMRHMQRRLAGWLAKAKVAGKSCHSLRHTFACRIYSATGDLQITQAALGHASIASIGACKSSAAVALPTALTSRPDAISAINDLASLLSERIGDYPDWPDAGLENLDGIWNAMATSLGFRFEETPSGPALWFD